MRPVVFRLGDRGGVGVIAAVGGALACIVAGVVIDSASVALETRRYQGAADLGALAAAAAGAERAQAAAEATVRANVPADGVVTVSGLYDADPGIPAASRFSSLIPAGTAANAARVTVSGQARLYFGRLLLGRETVSVSRTGLAAIPRREPAAAFSIGSRLARLDGGLANQVLGALTGSTVQLSVMDYEALADADVSLLAFSDALATRAGVTAGDYDRLLETRMTAGDALRAINDLTEDADAGLQKLTTAADDLELTVGDLIGTDVGTTDGLRGGLDAQVSALDLASAVIEVSGGDRQARLDTGLRTGLADLDVWLAIGERPNNSPWLAVSKDGQPVVRTAQARLYIEAQTAQTLAGLVQVRLPVLVELASSEARLSALDCDGDPRATLGVRPGIARARIGAVDTADLDDFKRALTVQPATLASVAGLVKVTGSADIEAAPVAETPVVFDAAAISNRTVKTVSSSAFASGTVTSLLERLDLTVSITGLGIGLGGLAGKTTTLLAPVGPILDTLVDGLLGALGLSLGEADVAINGVSCDAAGTTPVLVG